MRFLLYDAVIELEKGRRIVGRATFSTTDEWHRGHFVRTPLVPPVLFLEAMAQLLGWAIIHAHDFQVSAIMSLVSGFEVKRPSLRPGFEAEVVGEIVSTSPSDSLGRAWVSVAGERLARAERIIFTHARPADETHLRELFGRYSGLAHDAVAVPVPGGEE